MFEMTHISNRHLHSYSSILLEGLLQIRMDLGLANVPPSQLSTRAVFQIQVDDHDLWSKLGDQFVNSGSQELSINDAQQ